MDNRELWQKMELGLARLGDNNPPSQIKFTEDTATVLGAWLKDHPVVDSEEVARSGKLLVDRARLCLQDLDSERKGRVQPLQAQVKAIDDEYRSPKAVLDKILTELKDRLYAWIKQEEERRRQEAEEARKRAEEAERIAREAEEKEREAAADAAVGVETDIASATKEADQKFSDFKRSEREAARAEAATKVRVGGGFGRALGTRFKETLVVTDPSAAIQAMGWSDRLLQALITEAREYRRQHGQLSDGISKNGNKYPQRYLTSWNKERVAKLVNLWTDGFSASLIGKELGVSRNTIIGKVHRMGLPYRRVTNHLPSGRQVGDPRPPRRRKPPQPRQPTPQQQVPEPEFYIQMTKKEFMAPTNPPVGFIDLERHHCRFIIGTGDDNLALFCGAPKDIDSYCAYHASICYNVRAAS